MGKRGLKHDFFAPRGKTPLEDHPEVASEALKVIGGIHHHQIQWLGVRSAMIGKQGQPACMPSIACDRRCLEGILILQHRRSGLAAVSSMQPKELTVPVKYCLGEAVFLSRRTDTGQY